MSSEDASNTPKEETAAEILQEGSTLQTEATDAFIHQNPISYRCQQCRAVLFKSTDITSHEATKLRDFANKRRQYADGSNSCSSFFIEKPDWLDATGRMSDTIYCPKCNYKVGHFSWKGSQCSCGEWVKPSFQVPKSRVDAV